MKRIPRPHIRHITVPRAPRYLVSEISAEYAGAANTKAPPAKPVRKRPMMKVRGEEARQSRIQPEMNGSERAIRDHFLPMILNEIAEILFFPFSSFQN